MVGIVRKFSVVAKDDGQTYLVLFVIDDGSGWSGSGTVFGIERGGKLQTLKWENVVGVRVDEA